MLFQTHILLGIILFLLAREYLGGNPYLIFLFVLLGSILPDIDEPNSKISRWSGFIGQVIGKIAQHRGFFHSLLFFLILAFVINYYWNIYYALALLLGYTAHVIGDGITPMGIKIFYPFSSFRIKGPIKVGSFFETTLFVGLLILVLRELLF